MKNFFTLFLATVSVLVLSACTSYPAAGSVQAEVPPRIVMKNGSPIWDNPGNFGPVPAELLIQANQICGSLNTKEIKYEAKGYHAKALDLNGNLFANGGYYCLPKQ
ncbi:MAG: hypothetical protein ACKOXU_05190 [Limnohabitans sp.]